MNTAYLLLGGNEGNREAYLYQAVQMLRRTAGTVTAMSPIYETASWGKEELPPHLNQAVILDTQLTAAALLEHIHETEHLLGRTRTEQWGLRKIDIDIIFFNQDIIQQADLCIPHARMQDRRFVLQPLRDIAPDYVHPVLGITVATLLAQCSDPLSVQTYMSEDPWASLL